jgi:hypothetical protein
MKLEHVFMIFLVVVNLYLILPRLCGIKEFNAIPGASANIDETAWVNLHAILHELYHNDTLTIPGNLNVVGDIVSGNDITAGRNLHVGNEAGRSRGGGAMFVSKIMHGGDTGSDSTDSPKDAHGIGPKIQVWSPLELSANKSLHVDEIYKSGMDSRIRFHDHVHVGWQKTLNVGSGGLLEVEPGANSKLHGNVELGSGGGYTATRFYDGQYRFIDTK